MARKVVCYLCKTKGTTDTFYKVTDDKGKNKYYCSKEEYDNWILEKEKYLNLMRYIALEVLNYQDGQIVPPTIVKKIRSMNEFYDYEVIHECFVVNKENIQHWISVKNFESEFGMANYVMRIIENNINDVYNKWKHQMKTEQKQENTVVDLDIMNEVSTNKTTREDNGIMDFLDEEDI